MKTYIADIEIARPDFLGGGTWSLGRLSPITVLFGKNGSGKSLLMRAWRDSSEETAHYVVPERSGNLNFEPGYLKQQLVATGRSGVSKKNYLNEYRQHAIARVQAYLLTRGGSRDGDLPGRIEDLERLSSVLLPDFSIEFVGSNPPYNLTRTGDPHKISNVDELSSGEAQLITLGIDILTIAATWDIKKPEERILLIDEPDAHIHPDLQVRFADFLIQVGQKYDLQIVVASHSPTLLASIGQFGGDNSGVIYLDRLKSSFEARPFSDELKEIAACLGGHALMGPLFNVPLLLVEGDDDYRIWSQVPRHHRTSFAVIPCQGEEINKYQNSLERVLGSLRNPDQGFAGYALIDGDKGLPQPNPDRPQDHIKFIQLNCHESENLYLTDQTLEILGTNWEEASQKISAAGNSGQSGEKSEKLSNAENWDRKNDDIKDVINEIATILDEKQVHWTARVGVTIGRDFPEGQLREFLGEETVGSLWPAEEEEEEEEEDATASQVN